MPQVGGQTHGRRMTASFALTGLLSRIAASFWYVDDAVAGSGGRDTFGYAFVDSTPDPTAARRTGGVGPRLPVFNFVDISTTGTLVAQGDECTSVAAGTGCDFATGAPVPLGGTGFPFYGEQSTDVVPSTNGVLYFGDPTAGLPGPINYPAAMSCS